jgi:hypothetical protein
MFAACHMSPQFWTPDLPDARFADMVLMSAAWDPTGKAPTERYQNRVDLAVTGPAVRPC